MPWKETRALEEREKFIRDWAKQEDDFAELCRRYGISRPTGYKWVDRYECEGEVGLQERSRAPHHRPQAITDSTAERILSLRGEHPRWGARKLKAYLERKAADVSWPSASSIGDLLRREGLTQARRKRKRTPLYSEPLAHAQAPNQVWCADFKGWFLCGDGKRCDPLTITDAFSRYLIRCRSVHKTDGWHVRTVFEAAFRECGLPESIRTDNGAPFATRAPGGLSRLNMWWLRLGIRHERIAPGCPEQNGRHERMHGTLKEETASPPRASQRQQQQAFKEFQRIYNEQRPHEALAYETPASLYTASTRLYPSRLPEIEYGDDMQIRRVSQQGSVKWKGARTFISEVVSRDWVGLREADKGVEVWYGPLLLGWLDPHKQKFHQVKPDRPKRREPAKAI